LRSSRDGFIPNPVKEKFCSAKAVGPIDESCAPATGFSRLPRSLLKNRNPAGKLRPDLPGILVGAPENVRPIENNSSPFTSYNCLDG
jgi:hypothetical protein